MPMSFGMNEVERNRATAASHFLCGVHFSRFDNIISTPYLGIFLYSY